MHVSLFLLSVTAVFASPTPHNYVVHERRDALPSVWVEESRLDKGALLPMRIGLTQSNLDRGHDLLMEVYVVRLLTRTKLIVQVSSTIVSLRKAPLQRGGARPICPVE